ncbi:MAG TPA: thiamine phosphate synthase [Desulfomonilaceae bacterium]|nr:thiamine phosphate synthase [Desulfomonilaceae bacterium]
MTSIFTWDVYLVTDRAFSRGRTTLEIVRAALEGGVSAVQLREKNLDTRDFYEEGMKIRDLLRERRVPLIINDRIDVAIALDADGVHLGQTDMPVDVARNILGPGRIIGLSVELPEHIDDNALSHADYLAISPVFFTSTKPEASRQWGLEGLKRARALTDVPLVAIGSVKRENAGDIIQAGADCVAVVTAIVSEDDPVSATAALIAEVRKAKQARNSKSK